MQVEVSTEGEMDGWINIDVHMYVYMYVCRAMLFKSKYLFHFALISSDNPVTYV